MPLCSVLQAHRSAMRQANRPAVMRLACHRM